MTVQLRSSASNKNCVQGKTDKCGSLSKITTYPYLLGYISMDLYYCDYKPVYEVYSNGEVIGNPFCEFFNINILEEFVDNKFYYNWYPPENLPNFCEIKFFDFDKVKIFTVDGCVCVSNGIFTTVFDHGGVYLGVYNITGLFQLFPSIVVSCVMNAITLQSGLENNSDIELDYSYGRSKCRARWNNGRKVATKLNKVGKKLAEANLGSTKKNTKKMFMKKLRTKHIGMQSGIEYDSANVILFLEKLFSIFILKYYNSPIYVGLSAILMLVRSSLSITLYNSISYILSTIRNCKGTIGDFNLWLKDLVVDVEKFKNNRFASSFVEFFVKVWSTLLCPTMLYQWKENTLGKVVQKILSFFSSLGNPIECVIWALTYLVNGVDSFIKNGTFEGFLSTQTVTDDLMDKLRAVRSDFRLYVTGDLEFIQGYRQYEYLAKVDELRLELLNIRKTKRGIDLKLVDDWIKEVNTIQVECQKSEAQTGSRIQPYHFIITSGSGISKSHLLKLFCNTIALSNKIPCEQQYVFYLNQANKFQSGWANHKTIVMVDDSAAMHADSVTSSAFLNLADWTLRSANNVPHELLGADIKEKGTLFNKSLIEGWASNSFSQQFEKYARFPSAINRRFQLRIVGEVKPEYIMENSDPEAKSTRIDYNKLSPDQKESISPDAWLFTCYDCEIEDLGIEIKTDFNQPVIEHDANHRYVVSVDANGHRMDKVDIEQMLNFLSYHSRKHFSQQQEVLSINAKVYDVHNYCDHGLPRDVRCNECDGEQYFHNNVCEQDSLDDDSVYEAIKDISLQSGFSKNDVLQKTIYCNVLMQELRDKRFNGLSDKIRDTRNLFGSLKELFLELRNTFENLFTGMVLDVVNYFVDKIFSYVEKFIRDPLSFIPIYVEHTELAIYSYSKNNKLQFALILDYLFYLLVYKLPFISNITIALWMYLYTNLVYKLFISTKKISVWIGGYFKPPMSFQDFVREPISMISSEEKKFKSEHVDLVRDLAVPAILSYVTISVFIPNLIRQFSSLYCEIQVGYDISVEEIKKCDIEKKSEWFKNKTEIYLSKPPVTSNKTYTELENTLRKNIFFVRNLASKKIVSAVSFANQFVILPYHYAHESIGNVVQFIKTEIPSYENSGNAIIETQLCSHNIYKLKGDLCVYYLEKHMDHMRTKDLLDIFPLRPLESSNAGRLIYKSTLGVCNMLDATNIQLRLTPNNGVYNGTPHEGHFDGYMYKSENFLGLCGAVLVDETRKISSVLGIHVGGHSAAQISVASLVLRPDLEAAIKHFLGDDMLLQSGFDFENKLLKNYEPTIYKQNPFLDTKDRLDGVCLLGTARTRHSYDNKVVNTAIAEDVKSMFEVDYDFVAPPFKFDGDKRHGVRQLIRAFGKKNTVRDTGLLLKAQSDLRRDFLFPILYGDNKKYWQESIRVLNDFEVVNGVVGKRFLGGMNMSTAFGGGYIGAKSAYAEQLVDNTWKFEPWVMDLFHEYEEQFDKGIIVPDIVTQHLKLEATPKEKAEIGKVRSFFMSSTPIQMVLRKLFLTTCRYACLNTKHTEITVGINAHSTDWTKFLMEITKFGKNRMIALDLTNMDATILFEVLSGSLDIFFEPFNLVCNKDGKYTKRLRAIKTLLLFPLIDVHGDLVSMAGMLPSGTNLTSMIGCLTNSTYYRMAFYYMYKGTRVFSDLIALRVYGDDSITNVSKEADFFNVKSVLKAWEALGILGTDMEKNGSFSTRKYYNLSEIEFLKRKMVYQKDFGVVVAPLLKKSMFKCLLCHIPPRTVSLEFLTGQCIDNFLFEAKFHGREFYENSRRKLRIIAEKHDLLRFCNVLNITYFDMVEKWKVDNSDCALVTEQWRKCQPLWFRLVQSFNFDTQTWSGWTQNNNENNNMYDENQSVAKLVVALDEAQIKIQSGVEFQEKEVVTFIHSPDNSVLRVGSDTAPSRISGDKVSLGEFLKRPIVIDTFQWGSSPVYHALDPWEKLLTNPRIANRITNYKLFKATCHVKVLISGNGFYYGSMLLTYVPFHELGTLRPVNATSQDDLLVGISQAPHVFLNPTNSGGADMTLPFFYPYSYLSLNESANSRELGTLYFNSIVDLKHANQNLASTGEKVTITVYAWFDNVDLQAPTQKDMTALVPQSGREDESIEKPISQAATAVANVAAALTGVPVIGSYATAVEKAAKTTSSIASVLGFSKPVAVAEAQITIPRPFGTLAVTNTTSSAVKLTLDVKQETSISPLEVNMGSDDQLSFNYIAQKESYFSKFVWAKNSTPGTVLQSFVVTPYSYRKDVSTGLRISMTPVCGVANCFNYWTGSLIYRFNIVKSSFHKGRLVVTYDPTGTQSVREDNVNFSHIIDIGDTGDFELTISNYQERDWLQNRKSQFWYNETIKASGVITSGSATASRTNGVITFYILNELTTPNSDPTLDTDISIVCYVRAAPDFQVADPDTIGYWQTIPQSGIEIDKMSLDNTEPVQSIEHVNTLGTLDNKLFMGEVVTSFRNLLKRDNFYALFRHTATPSYMDLLVHPMYPLFKSRIGSFPPQPEIVGATANEVQMTMINYVRGAFCGSKGGVRWKISTTSTVDQYQVLVVRDDSIVDDYGIENFPYNNSLSMYNATSFEFGRLMARGGAITHSSVNPTIEFEMPYYATEKFLLYDENSTAVFTLHPYERIFKHILLRPSEAAATSMVTMFVSAAEDFTCYFFVGWRPLYVGP